MSSQPTFRCRVSLLLIAVFLTAIIMNFTPVGCDFAYFHYFPSGMFAPIAVFLNLQGNTWNWIFFFSGWVIYIGYIAYLLRQRTKPRFYMLYAGLCLLLAFNVGGCQCL